jgi:hypothetical protein
MPELYYLGIGFYFDVPSDYIKRALVDTTNAQQIVLPNLSEVFFAGGSSYLESLAGWISAPILEKFYVTFVKEPSSTLPYLSRFLSSAENFRLPVASIEFSGTGMDDPKVTIRMSSLEQTMDCWSQFACFQIIFQCPPLNVQVASTAQICTAIAPVLSAVKKLHLCLDGDRWQFGQDGDIENATWHTLLKPFRAVEKLQVDPGLMEDLSLALCPDDIAPPTHILPQLRKLTRPDYARFRDAFDGFIAVRQDAGQRIVKRRRPPMPWFGSDSEEENGTDQDDDDWEDDEREVVVDEESEVEREELGAEGGREEDDSDAERDPDSDSGSSDDGGFCTEVDSDSDFKLSALTYRLIDRP